MFRSAKKEEFSFDIYQYSKDHWPLICLFAIASVGITAAIVVATDDGSPIVFDAISMSVLFFAMLYASILDVAEDRARAPHEHAIEQDASPGLRR